jgi:hypothetical protein
MHSLHIAHPCLQQAEARFQANVRFTHLVYLMSIAVVLRIDNPLAEAV